MRQLSLNQNWNYIKNVQTITPKVEMMTVSGHIQAPLFRQLPIDVDDSPITKEEIDAFAPNQRDMILERLRTFNFVPTSWMRNFSQYNARIYELRRQGHNIISVRKAGESGFMLE